MSKPFDNLDKAFDIEAEIVEGLEREEVLPVKGSQAKPTKVYDKTDKEKDYDYVRSKFYSLLENAEEVIQEAMEMALQSGHPRAFEVVLKGIRDTSDLGDKLMDLHKKMRDLEVEDPKIQQTNVQNNVFMAGTTTELIKMLKESNQ
jgi:hypothetical protein